MPTSFPSLRKRTQKGCVILTATYVVCIIDSVICIRPLPLHMRSPTCLCFAPLSPPSVNDDSSLSWHDCDPLLCLSCSSSIPTLSSTLFRSRRRHTCHSIWSTKPLSLVQLLFSRSQRHWFPPTGYISDRSYCLSFSQYLSNTI